jgi:transposase
MVEHIFNTTDVLRPVEVFTSVERRRRWSAEVKGRIVAASFAPGAIVTEVARQHDISPQHLHLWRRQAKAGRLVLPLSDDDVMFVPVMLDRRGGGREPPGSGSEVEVEVEVAGAVIRVRAQTDLRLVAAIARALQAAS